MPSKAAKKHMPQCEPLESFFPSGSNAPDGPLTCFDQVPEPVWTSEGSGAGRVYRTESLGRRITMTRGMHYSREMWLLAVEDQELCYWDERLSLAKSRQHVALALDEYDRRKEAETWEARAGQGDIKRDTAAAGLF